MPRGSRPGSGASLPRAKAQAKKFTSGGKKGKDGRRLAYSTRDLTAAMTLASRIQSIPKGNARKKVDLFTSGALKSMQFAPRGHGYYDAFVQTPDSAVMAVSVGPCAVIKGRSSDVIAGGPPISNTEYSGNSTLIFFNPGSSDNVIAHVYSIKVSEGENNITAGKCYLFIYIYIYIYIYISLHATHPPFAPPVFCP